MTTQSPSAPPCVLVIFGAAGDLTQRLLMPALYNLRRARLLPENFAVIGVARAPKDDGAFRKELADSLRLYGDKDLGRSDADWLAARMFYLQGDFDDASAYEKLTQLLEKIDQTQQTDANYLFYLATPPQAFATIPRNLSRAGLLKESDGHWRRVIIEKPFGTDLRSAQDLNGKLLSVLAESQIYRIDHYLGKETVQNIMVLRFANGMFEPLWNRNHVDHVQITVAETVGVEQRGKFYDATGALRDMIPNHLFQLVTLIAMEPPTCFDAEAVRTEKAKVLEATHAFGREDAKRNVVRAQYCAGSVDGKTVTPYRHAVNVPAGSTTETYVALKLGIDNWRWAGVPFYVRTGKALAARRSEVVIEFKQAPFALFRDTPVERLTPNDMRILIQPEEGITLRFSAKIPGPSVRMEGVAMKFNYREHFHAAPSTGYETLIYDCMLGDPTLFQRADNIEAGWRVVQPILDAWAEDRTTDMPIYPAGSAGPPEADALLERDHRRWRAIRMEDGTS
jgi:glucose-6-phosphate 1-dehydrogenase